MIIMEVWMGCEWNFEFILNYSFDVSMRVDYIEIFNPLVSMNFFPCFGLNSLIIMFLRLFLIFGIHFEL